MTNGSPAWHISYQRPIEYEIVNCPGLFEPENDALLSVGRRENTRRFVVVDSNVNRIHAAKICGYFEFHNVRIRVISFPGGEQSKSVDCYLSLLNELDSFPIDRRDEPIIAIGGGVLTDLVGFLASTYRRGVPHIKVPTTLMGYVDASVGIKNGLNFHSHKNRLGSFEPPRKVLLDKAFLASLPLRHILNGVCEILKLALIRESALFELLETYGAQCIDSKFQDAIGSLILDRSIRGMIAELQPNLFEDKLERRMDFGHTFSYGLEAAPDSDWLHGEAVLMDMLLSVFIAVNRQLLSLAELSRILNLVSHLGLVLNEGVVDPDVLWSSLQERVLHRDGFQRIPLPHGIGHCSFVNDVTQEEVRSACWKMLQACRA